MTVLSVAKILIEQRERCAVTFILCLTWSTRQPVQAHDVVSLKRPLSRRENSKSKKRGRCSCGPICSVNKQSKQKVTRVRNWGLASDMAFIFGNIFSCFVFLCVFTGIVRGYGRAAFTLLPKL